MTIIIEPGLVLRFFIVLLLFHMWNQVSCKSDYKDFLRQREDRKLLNTLNKVKSAIDTSCPKSYKTNFHRPFGTDRKTYLRKQEIKEENKALLKKMLKIDLLPANENKKTPSVYITGSMNKRTRLSKQKEIKNSNKHIFQRLRSAEPVYSIEKWNDFNKFHLYIRENISRNSGRVSKRKLFDCDKKANEAEDLLDQLM